MQADLKAIHAAGCYGVVALTSVVAEAPGDVRSIHNLPAALVAEQIQVCFDHFPITAVKTGMLPTAEIIETITQLLTSLRNQGRHFELVVDPVMVASTGDKLISDHAIETYRSHLIPIASLVTPNLDETSVLLKRKISTLAELQSAAVELAAYYQTSFLCKGGHLKSSTLTDVLVHNSQMWLYESSYFPNAETHGSGCTFSSAIAARLALGHDLPTAVAGAKNYLAAAIEKNLTWPKSRSLAHLQLPQTSPLQPPAPKPIPS